MQISRQMTGDSHTVRVFSRTVSPAASSSVWMKTDRDGFHLRTMKIVKPLSPIARIANASRLVVTVFASVAASIDKGLRTAPSVRYGSKAAIAERPVVAASPSAIPRNSTAPSALIARV